MRCDKSRCCPRSMQSWTSERCSMAPRRRRLRWRHDLLQRLGLSAEDRQQDFRIYAHATFGRGWVDREPDVDRMNEQLAKALTDRAPLDQRIEKAKQSVLFE